MLSEPPARKQSRRKDNIGVSFMYAKMISVVFCLLAVLSVGFSTGCGTKVDTKPSVERLPDCTALLANLRREHPRLLFTMSDQRRIEKLAGSNAVLAEMIVQLKKNAERILTEPAIKKKYGIGYEKKRHHLGRSRCCLSRILTLSMTYRLTGERRFAQYARKEMLAITTFPTWNPRHFLDVGEMSSAMAIGYDWLYDFLSPTDRATIRNAIVTLGLKPGLDAYTDRKKHGWWTNCPNNWNQVCNGGLVLGALAIAEDKPKLSAKIISHALHSIHSGMSTYKGDGVCPEGPGYWIYGTNFNALMISALDTALGSDFGLSKTKGFDKTGNYLMHVIQPGGKRCFNYADGGRGVDIAPAMFFLAKKFNRPQYAWFERRRMQRRIEQYKQKDGEYKINYCGAGRLYAMEIAWFDPRGTTDEVGKQPLDIFFRSIVPIVAMRSAWNDSNALYVTFKGGLNTASHGHLDIGSFVLESDGVDWAIDLGADSYSLPGYWDGKKQNGRRWKYYRLGSKSHNTLVIGGKLQHVSSDRNRVIKFFSRPARAHGVVGMSKAYKGQAKKVLRGVAMLNRSAVLIQDEITVPKGEIRWGMLTEAKIRLSGAKATLTKDGKTLAAEILSPAGAKFKIVTPPTPGKGQRPHPKNLSMLAVFVKPGGKKPIRLTVLLTPIGKRWQKIPAPEIKPLNQWISSR